MILKSEMVATDVARTRCSVSFWGYLFFPATAFFSVEMTEETVEGYLALKLFL